MAHVFFSYSRSDRELARKLRRDLREGGLDIWSDRELDLGGRWLTAISVAISQSQAVVLLATPAALASKWVMREVTAAQTLGIQVIPLLAEGARYSDLPVSLAGINGVDLADGYDESVTMIVSGLCDLGNVAVGAASTATEARTLVLITSDEALASTVAEISRSVGLVIDRPNGDPDGLLTMLASAHITVVDATPRDALFIAGYAAGQGSWVIWLARAVEGVPAAAGVRFSPRTAAALEHEICSAAFLPSRHPR